MKPSAQPSGENGLGSRRGLDPPSVRHGCRAQIVAAESPASPETNATCRSRATACQTSKWRRASPPRDGVRSAERAGATPGAAPSGTPHLTRAEGRSCPLRCMWRVVLTERTASYLTRTRSVLLTRRVTSIRKRIAKQSRLDLCRFLAAYWSPRSLRCRLAPRATGYGRAQGCQGYARDARRFAALTALARAHETHLSERVDDRALTPLITLRIVVRTLRWPNECGPNTLQSLGSQMESIASPEIARGFSIGVRNSGGAVWRGEGGAQERELGAKYRGWSQKLAFKYPYVASVVEEKLPTHMIAKRSGTTPKRRSASG